MWYLIAFAVLVLLLSVLAIVVHITVERKKSYKDLKNKHVIVTGGSSGIGKAAAAEAVKQGGNVTIIGRDERKLKAAVEEILEKRSNDNGSIQYAVLDVTSDYNTIKNCLASLEAEHGPIFMLINCAGMSICGEFENMKPDDIKQMIDLNYFGTAYPTRYVLPGMRERDEGIIVFVSSEAALIGLYGLSSYSGGKWAVRGLAESVMMELVGSNISLTLSFPPDTDTPGFKQEELSKPKETKEICGAGGLLSPEFVGQKMIQDAMARRSYSVYGFTGNLMTILYGSTVESACQVLVQIISLGLLRAVMVCFQLSFFSIIRNGLKEKKRSLPEKSK